MICIRPIRESDVESFRETLDAVCRERKYLARSEAPPLQNVRAFIEANVRAGHPQFVAEEDGRVVGWCDALPDHEKFGRAHVAILGMGILRDYRGRKIGSRLLDAVIVATRLRDLEKIELVVHASNTPAVTLYRKTGFEIEGVKKRGLLVDGEYDDVILMGLSLQTRKQPQP